MTWINELHTFYCRNTDIFKTFGVGLIRKEEHLSRVNG